jgi:hypothetical protein
VSGELSYIIEPIENIEPGKIFSVDTNYIEIKTADKVVKLRTLENLIPIIGTNKYIHSPTKYILKNPNKFEKLF